MKKQKLKELKANNRFCKESNDVLIQVGNWVTDLKDKGVEINETTFSTIVESVLIVWNTIESPDEADQRLLDEEEAAEQLEQKKQRKK